MASLMPRNKTNVSALTVAGSADARCRMMGSAVHGEEPSPVVAQRRLYAAAGQFTH